jgi:hypothetical protein
MSHHCFPTFKGIPGSSHSLFIGFKVLTAVNMESSVFLDISPCSPAKVNRTCRLSLQDRRDEHEADSDQSCRLAWLTTQL